MYTNEHCIIIDESGNLGKKGRYFVIACISTLECKSLHNVMKRQLKKVKEIFPGLGQNHANEIKAAEANPQVKGHILKTIAAKNIDISYIAADLKYIEPKLLKDKNIAYNYFAKLLLDHVITPQDINCKINVLCDNKDVKVRSANSFADYIKLYFNYEKNYNLDLNICYMDSDANNAFVIQAADYAANAIYSYHEYQYSPYYDLIKHKIGHKILFPWKNFGR